ncbi:MAG: MltA-interacting MipA family protein [Alphaproteobacteria bacterium]|nr:MltA-interacting MipA family protein [Alphaproteobacteria bacterium]
MTKLFFPFLLCLLGFSSFSLAKDPPRYPGFGQGDTSPGATSLPRGWELTAAAGAAHAPEYPGSEDYEAIFTPAVYAEYKQKAFLVIDRQSMMAPYEGLGYKFIGNQIFSFGVNATYEPGRDATGRIAALDDIDATALGGIFAAYHPGAFYLRGQLGHDLLGEFDSYKGEIATGVAGPLSPYWRGMIDISGAFAGDDYLQNYFGVTPGQSAASGLAPYTAEAGLYRVAMAATLQYQFDTGAFIQGIGRADHYVGDAGDSPIVAEDTNLTLQGMIGYRF